MFETLLALLPKIPAVVASLPEFLNLFNSVKSTLSETDQATLQTAYELAQDGSDDAHAELQALVAANS
jgi:hypothetical protein